MARSITFTIEGEVETLVTVTELDDGTLLFEMTVVSGTIGDLRAVFFDLQGYAADDSLFVTDAVDVTGTAYEEAGVDTLGKDANIKGAVSNELGDFDVGIEFGTSGMDADDIQSTSFVLGSTGGALTLDMLNVSDFGIRYTSVGEAGGDRTGSAKIGDQASGVADNDALALDEGATAELALLINDDTAAGSRVTGAVSAAGTAFAASGSGFTAAILIGGATYGTILIAEDGTMTVIADGPDADALAAGESVSFRFTYTSTAPDGSLATADAVVTINGVNDAPAAGDDAARTDEDAVLVITAAQLLGNDGDAEGDSLSIVSVDSSATLGTLTDNGDGTWTYDPNGQFDGLADGETATDSFSYTVSDGQGGSATATVTVTIDGVSGLPLFTDAGETVNFSQVLAGSYSNGTQYAALGGDDTVFLPLDAAAAAAAGYDLTRSFDAGAGNDIVWGSLTSDTILLGDGNDFARGYDGDDRLEGGLGNDRLIADAGTDSLFGGAGNDWLILGAGDDYADGGEGLDILDFGPAPGGVTVDLTLGVATGHGSDSFTAMEVFYGSQHDDIFVGDDTVSNFDGRNGNDTIRAGGGNDGLVGANGNDSLYGEAGDDYITEGAGSDLIDGGDGIDTLSYGQTAPAGPMLIDMAQGIATDGVDTDSFTGIENIMGSPGDDTIIGDAGDNRIEGFRGDDVMTGGAGADVFFYVPRAGIGYGNDIITDFTIGEDLIRIHGISLASPEVGKAEINGDAVLTMPDGTTVTLLGVTLLELDAAGLI